MTPEISTIIIDSSIDAIRGVQRILESHSENAGVVGVAATFERGYELIFEKRPGLVIMEADEEELSVALGRIKAILARFPKTAIFVTGKKGSSEAILTLLRAGATEYLPKPVTEPDLISAVQKLARTAAPVSPGEGDGKIYSVFSPKGGAGVTTVATNLAVHVHEETGKPTIIVDLDHTTSDVATFLDLKPDFTIRDCVNSADLDRGLLQKIITRHKSGVYVLPQPLMVGEVVPLSGEGLRKLLDLLKTMFGYIVLDTEPHVSEATITAMQMSDLILLLFVMSLPSIKNTRKYLEYLDRRDIGAHKIVPVVNRYHRKGDITIEEAESAIQKRIVSSIPNDYAVAIESLNRGMPFNSFAPQSRLNTTIRDLAARITGKEKEGLNAEGEAATASRFGMLYRNLVRKFVDT